MAGTAYQSASTTSATTASQAIEIGYLNVTVPCPLKVDEPAIATERRTTSDLKEHIAGRRRLNRTVPQIDWPPSENVAMSAEQEVIEQIETERLGRPLGWVCNWLRSLERDEPFLVINGMLHGGYIPLLSLDGKPLPDWKWEQIMRSGVVTDDVLVAATDSGSRWVHGR